MKNRDSASAQKTHPNPRVNHSQERPDVSGFYDFKAVPQLWQ